MAMSYQKALRGLLILVFITASMGITIVSSSRDHAGTGALGTPYPGQEPMTSEDPSVPEWNQFNHTMIAIDTEEAPLPSSTIPAGVSGVSVDTYIPTWNKALTNNATNLQSDIKLNYTARFNITCTNHLAISNYTVRLNTPLIFKKTFNDLLISTNLGAVTIYSYATTNQTTFYPAYLTQGSAVYPVIWPKVTEFKNTTSMNYFNFNISQAVHVFESSPLYTGVAFRFEVGYTVTLNITSWAMYSKPGESFRIEGSQSTRSMNYTVACRLIGPKGVNVTFHYIPSDRNLTSNHKFYLKNALLSPTPSYESRAGGWSIAPPGKVQLNSTGVDFKVEFRCNSTIGFIEQKAGKWNSDGVATRLDLRTRKFKLAVLSGPMYLLIERVEFTVRDIAYSSVLLISRTVEPASSITVSDDTYKYYDPTLEKEVTKSNGTKVLIGRIQKAKGPVLASFTYNASYSAALRVLDELRNPIPGAEITLYFHGVRFGPLMSAGESSLQPPKLADALGNAQFINLPEGNYSVEVRYQGQLVKNQSFSLYGSTMSLSIDIVTPVPYQPWILVSWLAIFGIACVIGVLLFKRKK